MSSSSKSEFCKPCYVSCDGCAFIVMRITRIFRGSDTDQSPDMYKWFADYESTNNQSVDSRDCDKGFTGCGADAAIDGALAAAGREFNTWLETQLGPETTNPNYRPRLVKKGGCLSCNVDIRVGIQICFTAVTVVYNQAADICPPCESEVAVDPSSVKITIGPYNI